MTIETLRIIHQSYQEALEKSANLLEIAEKLYEILNEIEINNEEDVIIFDSFLDGLRGCIQNRRKTFEITNLSIYIIVTMMYIVLWLNSTKNMHIDIKWKARCKALESELTKLIRKSNSNLSANIRDRFGLKGIVQNDLKEKEIEEIIYIIFDCTSGILAGKNRKMKKEFAEWVKGNKNIMPMDKSIVEQILTIPFAIDFVKDYIQEPKANGYKSLQFTMTVQMYSEVLPGCQLEIQFKSRKMEEEAEHGKASHDAYKLTGGLSEEELSEVDKYINKVFTAEDFTKIHIVGFTGYKSKEEDINGIHFAKEFADRRISTTLVPSN